MWPCERLDVIDSTQRELQRRLAAASRSASPLDGPFAVWTTQQTDGIASHGRRWLDASHGFAFSVAWREALHGSDAVAWPVRLSLAVTSALESLYPLLAQRLGVKWPNDIMCGQEKLAGVLVSRHAVGRDHWLVAGIGINLQWDGSQPIDRPVTSLAKLGVAQVDEPLLARRLCQSVSTLWDDVRKGIGWRHEFERRDVHYRRRVSVVHPMSGRLLHEGVAEGISDGGELMLRVGESLCAIQIGEVSVRAQNDGSRGDLSMPETV